MTHNYSTRFKNMTDIPLGHQYNTRFKNIKTISAPVHNTYHYNTRFKTIKNNIDGPRKYNTRSSTLPVSIDFDDASKHWRANKIHTGNGCFEYTK
jgi:hypothetical protein